MSPQPTAAVIEIVERARKTDDTLGGSVIVPNEIRINGHPVLVAEGGIKIHEMNLGTNNEAMLVTLTLFARRVVIAAEGDL
jgi:hypothetical protein